VKQPPPRAELSEGLRGEIISIRKHNQTFPIITTELSVHEDTARKIWNYYKKTGAYKPPPRPGRPTLTDDRTRRLLKRHIQSNRDTWREPLSEMMSKLNINIYTTTLRKEITEELGMGHRIKRRKP
jgi:transposase